MRSAPSVRPPSRRDRTRAEGCRRWAKTVPGAVTTITLAALGAAWAAAPVSAERTVSILAVAPEGVPVPALQQAPPPDTIEVATNPLESASLGFARALETGSGDELARYLRSDGIRLQLEGVGHAGLSTRQAVAALRGFLRGYDGGTTIVTRAAPVEGSQERAFAEVSWSARAAGTSDEIRRTLFLGFHLDGDDWRIDEVRFLR